MDKVARKVFNYVAEGKIDAASAAELLKEIKLQEVKSQDDIAIIGMHAKMPLTDNADEFWSCIRDGKDCVTPFPENRQRDVDGFIKYTYYACNENIKFCEGGYLKEIDKFDYSFFGISPKEASLMDPNQRVFLECTFNAMEDAGYGGKGLYGSRTGLYVGYSGWPMYGQFISHIEPSALTISVAGNISAILASRIPHMFDFRGPSMLVDTACSSALTAFHLACEGIRNGDCDMAIAGGIRIILMPIEGIVEYGIESKNYRAKAFDEAADGTSLSEGVASLVLKPLKAALKDRDHIYAVVKGSAINQDGNSIGITAPNAIAQEDVIVKAWEAAGIHPETLSYIETHGTGTKLGDPIEIEGIQKAFRRYTNKRQFCAISSVKTNIGHTDCCSGLAGLIKAVLALKNRQIPPSIHFNRPNRKINFANSPVYVNDRLIPWEEGVVPRRCGVSSFGFSGTNCHVVLEEAPAVPAALPLEQEKEVVFCLSAKSQQTLKRMLDEYNDFLSTDTGIYLEDMCYTLGTGRGHYEFRLAVIASSMEELKQKIRKIASSDLNNCTCDNVFYGQHKVIASGKENRQPWEMTELEMRELSKEAAEQMNTLLDETDTERRKLQNLCGLYSRGAQVDWERLFSDRPAGRVSLPHYPFERSRCWVEFPEEYDRESLLFWQEALKDGIPVLHLPCDYAGEGHEKGIVRSQRGKEIIERIERFNNKYKSDYFSVITVMLSVLLFRYTGQDDFALWLVAPGDAEKSKKAHADMSSLPIQCHLSGQQSLEQYMSDTAEKIRVCLEHSRLNVERLIRKKVIDLNTEENFKHAVVLAFCDSQAEKEDLENYLEEYKPDIMLILGQDKQELNLELVFNRKLLREETVLRISDSFLKILEDGLENPQTAIRDIKLESDCEVLENVLQEDIDFSF